MNKKIQNIIIANDAEAFESIINTIDDDFRRTSKIKKEHFLSSRFLFWEGDNKIVITPFPVEQSLIAHAKSIGYKNVFNWYPAKIDISLSDAILKDKKLLKHLIAVIKENPGVTFSPYCFTEDFSRLIDFFRRSSLRFRVDQEPVKNARWLVGYLGSKVGFRVEMQKIQAQSGDVPVPEFFICRDRKAIIDAAAWFYKNHRSSVIKAFSGEGGWGVYMVRVTDYSSEVDLRKKIKSILYKDTIWHFGPFLVEEFISSLQNDQNSPSLEIYVSDRGYQIQYLCNQIVNASGWFMGILIGRNCIKKNIAVKIKNIGQSIARRYFQLGYRGFFDIDFIVSKTGIPYPIETNTRRTGGTHVFDITRHLFGGDWPHSTVAFSTDSFRYGGKIMSVGEMIGKLSSILFPMAGTREGVVVAAVDAHHPVFSFVIFAQSRKKVLQIHKKLTSLFN